MKKYFLAAFVATILCAPGAPKAVAQGTTVPLEYDTCTSCSGLNNSAKAMGYALDFTFANPEAKSTYLLIEGNDGTYAYFWIDATGMPTATGAPSGSGGGGSGGSGGGGGGGGGNNINPGDPCDLGPCGDPITNPD